MLTRRLALASALTALLSACATTQAPVPLADAIARDPQLSTLAGLIQRAGLTDTLRTAGPYTLFAPTNDAFKAVPQKTLDELAANPARLRSVLAYHVLPVRVTAAEVKVGNTKTLEGANLALGKAGTFVTVEDAMVQTADIAATNGVIHTIDRVLMPPVRR